ncbi:hypothetical protein SAMN05444339_10833 [Loktanella atrilutea]|uniref:Cyclopropane-fatty-acyl-phospholipid synthase n=1 Tax=Loktanella atrilutea TaxID=366533 RepID=A0A1M5CP04_LOKAT|nr:DUF1365 domain-containing protein [Loktanella atrilutea]SHF56453.1 hypothetical protein SAMN05444339_10833 [Loktanella atrilutea]
MSSGIDHVAGQTFHGRKGAVKNAFRYSIDYVICDAEAAVRGPALFGRNRRGVMALHDRDHGGAIKDGRGAEWVRQVLKANGVDLTGRIDLLAQPRVLGHVFNPVSFWLIHDDAGVLRCVIAEVGNTFGDRHSYLCRTPDLAPITAETRLTAEKIFHVSPFQPISGGYVFRFDITSEAIDIRIDYTRGEGGLVATLSGARRPLTNGRIIRAILRRPFGSRRVLALIHWQAVKLWWKGATFRRWSKPPTDEVS